MKWFSNQDDLSHECMHQRAWRNYFFSRNRNFSQWKAEVESMFVVPLSCLSICRSGKFILLPCNSLPGDTSHLEGRWKKSQLSVLTWEFIKFSCRDWWNTIIWAFVLVPSISTVFRAVPAPGHISLRPRMVTAFTELNSGADWQKMLQKRIWISVSEKLESTHKSGVSNIGTGAKHLSGWAAAEACQQAPSIRHVLVVSGISESSLTE